MKNDGTLGVISCYSLSDQIAYLINRDEEIDGLFVVDNPEGVRFVKKMTGWSREKDIRLVAPDQLPRRSTGSFSLVLWLNPGDLHNNPGDLQQAQLGAYSKISDHSDSVLFCYGLCRSSEGRIRDLRRRAAIPLTFLTDRTGEIVDDCFGALIGGKREYLDCIKKGKGTLFASSGYVESWRKKYADMDLESIVREVEGLKQMFDSLGYHRLLVLDDGLGERESFEKDILTFSRTFDLELATRKCELKVFEQSYDLAKRKIEKGRMSEIEGTVAGEPSLSDIPL